MQFKLPYDLTLGSFILTVARCHFCVPELGGKSNRGSKTGSQTGGVKHPEDSFLLCVTSFALKLSLVCFPN